MNYKTVLPNEIHNYDVNYIYSGKQNQSVRLIQDWGIY